MKEKFYVIITKDAQKIFTNHPATRYGKEYCSMSNVSVPENLIQSLEKSSNYCKYTTVEAAKEDLLDFIEDKSTYKASDFAVVPVEMEVITKTKITPYITIEDPNAEAKELYNSQKQLCNKELRKMREDYALPYMQNVGDPSLHDKVISRINNFCKQFGNNQEDLSNYMYYKLRESFWQI